MPGRWKTNIHGSKDTGLSLSGGGPFRMWQNIVNCDRVEELIKRFTVMANTVVVLNEGSLRFEFNEHNCEHINKVINQ